MDIFGNTVKQNLYTQNSLNMLEKQINARILELKEKPVTYTMGVSGDGNIQAYCLVRDFDGTKEIILAKKHIIKEPEDKLAFEQVVTNLCRYFNVSNLIEEK